MVSRPRTTAAVVAVLGALLLVVATALVPAAQQPGSPYPGEIPLPIAGQAGPGLEVLDAAVRAMLRHHGIPGASLALAYQGRLVLAKGYGYADLAADAPVQPTTLFGLASLSKPITALAILRLIEEGKLTLESRPFELLAHLRPPRGARVDRRLRDITVRQLLN